jgi:hypothetical protein
MSEVDWLSLNVGDCVVSIGGKKMIVSDICEDPRILAMWVEKGYTNVKRLCNMELKEINYHTWSCDHSKWFFG